MKSFLRNADFWSGLALAALGAWIVSEARTWSYMGEDGPGAGFFPIWYGSAMIVLSLVLVAATVLKKPSAREAIRWRDLGRALTCWLAFVAAIALMPFAGFAICFAFLTWFIVAVMARRPQRIALALAIGGAIAFHAIFVWALDLSLPTGMLF
jgi:putative tricarboxylic transport membrane protein